MNKLICSVGVPAHNTFSRMLGLIDPKQLTSSTFSKTSNFDAYRLADYALSLADYALIGLTMSRVIGETDSRARTVNQRSGQPVGRSEPTAVGHSPFVQPQEFIATKSSGPFNILLLPA